MTFEDAVTELGSLCDSESDPVLTEADLEGIVTRARRVDPDGYLVSEDDWVFTVDLAWAAMTGWRLKAARAAGRFDFTADGATFSRSQVRAGCLEMAELYARAVNSSPRCA